MLPPALPLESAAWSPEDLPRRLARSWPARRWADVGVVLAVSGGADSTALLRAMSVLRPSGSLGSLHVAHYNHHWRGAESDADEHFVRHLAAGCQVPCTVGHDDPQAPARDEATARERRYDFLQATAETLGARYVAVAHTANDQAETVLQRIVRGTGLTGLAGMPRVRRLGPAVTLIRPLLECRRDELRAYLSAIAQEFRHDTTNDLPHYTRGALRHEVLPRLAELNPRVEMALVRLAAQAREAQELIKSLAERLCQRAVVDRSARTLTLDCRVLAAEPPYLVQAMLRELWVARDWPQQAMSESHWRKLCELAQQACDLPASEDSPSSLAHTLPGNIQARRIGDLLLLAS